MISEDWDKSGLSHWASRSCQPVPTEIFEILCLLLSQEHKGWDASSSSSYLNMFKPTGFLFILFALSPGFCVSNFIYPSDVLISNLVTSNLPYKKAINKILCCCIIKQRLLLNHWTWMRSISWCPRCLTSACIVETLFRCCKANLPM